MSIIKRFLPDRNGLALVEFALILPTMILIWAAIVEFTNIQSVGRKVNLAAQSIADILAQEQSVTQTELRRVVGLANVIMTPYPVDGLNVGVQSIQADNNGNVTVGWREGATGGITGTARDLVTKNDSTIHVRVKYAYRPQLAGLIGSDVLAGLINMTQEAYAKPRLTTIIPLK